MIIKYTSLKLIDDDEDESERSSISKPGTSRGQSKMLLDKKKTIED